MAGAFLGCCCDGALCTNLIEIPIRLCRDDARFFPASSISATGPDGSPALVIIGGRYTAQVEGHAAGTYTVTIDDPAYYPRSFSVTLACPDYLVLPRIYLRPRRLTFSASSLCGGLDGSTLTLGGVYSGSCSPTTAAPACTIDVPDIPGTDAPGDYTATLSLARYVDEVRTYSWSDNTWTCSDSIRLGTPVEGYCCGYFGCPYPIWHHCVLTTPMGVDVDVDLCDGEVNFHFTAPVLGHPAGAPDDPCVGCHSPLETVDVPFTFQLAGGFGSMFYKSCGFDLAPGCGGVGDSDTGSADPRAPGAVGGISIILDSVECGPPFVLTGHIPAPYTGPSYQYIIGDYTLTETGP